MKIHLIAVGGSAMHNMALALQELGHEVTGSDDEIYDPARSRLEAKGLLPDEIGWNPERITSQLDAVILGMHARINNPELLRAQELGVPVYSYPEYVYKESLNKKRIVVAGSHGKTSTTAMILHVLNKLDMNTDYLVGAQLKGFDTMVRLTDAPLIVLEGDEYLSSPIERVPKIHFYRPHITIITGVAWDHINVFPTFENYVDQFRQYLEMIEENGTLIYYKGDKVLDKIVGETNHNIRKIAYDTAPYNVIDNQTILHDGEDRIPLKIFGAHNLQNLEAARLVCQEIGITNQQFYDSVKDFEGAAKRLQRLAESEQSAVFLDFAHAPSKVEATIKAFKQQYKDRSLVACFELHTFSSLNKDFLNQYQNTMQPADEAIIFYSHHTLKMKKLPDINSTEVQAAFNHPNCHVFTEKDVLFDYLISKNWEETNLLLMTSGKFNGMDLPVLTETVTSSTKK